MFLGGLIMALAIEGSGLHQRIALKVLMVTGGHSLRIVMLGGSAENWLNNKAIYIIKFVFSISGVMCATAFLSMWISNTATTAMMLPMIDAVVSALGEKSGQKVDEEQQAVREDSKTQGNQQQQVAALFLFPSFIKCSGAV